MAKIFKEPLGLFNKGFTEYCHDRHMFSAWRQNASDRNRKTTNRGVFLSNLQYRRRHYKGLYSSRKSPRYIARTLTTGVGKPANRVRRFSTRGGFRERLWTRYDRVWPDPVLDSRPGEGSVSNVVDTTEETVRDVAAVSQVDDRTSKAMFEHGAVVMTPSRCETVYGVGKRLENGKRRCVSAVE